MKTTTLQVSKDFHGNSYMSSRMFSSVWVMACVVCTYQRSAITGFNRTLPEDQRLLDVL